MEPVPARAPSVQLNIKGKPWIPFDRLYTNTIWLLQFGAVLLALQQKSIVLHYPMTSSSRTPAHNSATNEMIRIAAATKTILKRIFPLIQKRETNSVGARAT